MSELPEAPTPAPAPKPPSKAPRTYNPLTLVLGLSALFFAVFLIISGVVYLYKPGSSSSGKPAGGASLFSGGGSVGVIELNGVIMDSKRTLRRLERFEESDEIKAVVLRLNSPGGSVAPSQEIYEAVRAFKKPLVVSMGSVAASGAFYIAMGSKKVFANPGTITGSIGVIMEFLNLERLYEWAKVKRFALTTGKYKGSGSDYKEMTPDERALLQSMIDDVLLQFKTAVSQGRGLTMEQVTAIADGRVLSGNQALKAKLVDELGTLQDAVNEAGKLAKIKGKPDVIYQEKAKSRWLDLLLDERGDDVDGESAIRPFAALQSFARALLAGDAVSADSSASQGLANLGPGIYWLWSGR